MKIQENFLDDLLVFATLNKNNFELVQPYLKDNFLPDEDYLKIWKEMRSYYDGHNQSIVKLKGLIQILQNQHQTKNERSIGICKRLLQNEVPEYNEVVSIFERFIKQLKFIEIYDELGETYNRGDKEKAFESFLSKAESFRDFSLKKNKYTKIFREFDHRNVQRILNHSENKFHCIPTGFEFLDRDSEGGFWTSETELWLADSGGGKSKLLVTRGIESAKRGYNVLHVQLEGSEEQATANYDACWTGLRYLDVKIGSIGEEVMNARSTLAQKLIKRGYGEVFLRTATDFGEISIQKIRNYLLELQRDGVEIHHLIIDYFDLITIEDGKKYDYENGEIERQVFLARKLKNLAVEFNILVTTATQSHTINPQLLNQPDFVMTRFNLGRSTRKIEPFSYFLTINRTSDEIEMNLARIYADKYREFKSGQTYKIAQNLGCSRFYDRKKTREIFTDYDYD